MGAEDDNRSVELVFDEAVFSISAIKKAAYVISHLASVDIRLDDGKIKCALRPHTPGPTDSLVADFRIEVLDQDLRETIADETAALRNAILAHAFSRTGLQQ